MATRDQVIVVLTFIGVLYALVFSVWFDVGYSGNGSGPKWIFGRGLCWAVSRVCTLPLAWLMWRKAAPDVLSRREWNVHTAVWTVLACVAKGAQEMQSPDAHLVGVAGEMSQGFVLGHIANYIVAYTALYVAPAATYLCYARKRRKVVMCSASGSTVAVATCLVMGFGVQVAIVAGQRLIVLVVGPMLALWVYTMRAMRRADAARRRAAAGGGGGSAAESGASRAAEVAFQPHVARLWMVSFTAIAVPVACGEMLLGLVALLDGSGGFQLLILVGYQGFMWCLFRMFIASLKLTFPTADTAASFYLVFVLFTELFGKLVFFSIQPFSTVFYLALVFHVAKSMVVSTGWAKDCARRLLGVRPYNPHDAYAEAVERWRVVRQERWTAVTAGFVVLVVCAALTVMQDTSRVRAAGLLKDTGSLLLWALVVVLVVVFLTGLVVRCVHERRVAQAKQRLGHSFARVMSHDTIVSVGSTGDDGPRGTGDVEIEVPTVANPMVSSQPCTPRAVPETASGDHEAQPSTIGGQPSSHPTASKDEAPGTGDASTAATARSSAGTQPQPDAASDSGDASDSTGAQAQPDAAPDTGDASDSTGAQPQPNAASDTGDARTAANASDSAGAQLQHQSAPAAGDASTTASDSTGAQPQCDAASDTGDASDSTGAQPQHDAASDTGDARTTASGSDSAGAQPQPDAASDTGAASDSAGAQPQPDAASGTGDARTAASGSDSAGAQPQPDAASGTGDARTTASSSDSVGQPKEAEPGSSSGAQDVLRFWHRHFATFALCVIPYCVITATGVSIDVLYKLQRTSGAA